jgi:starch phosphorylase
MVSAYSKALARYAPKLEELEEHEQEPGLGNGGLGRLASCFLDSLATCEYPGWGYSLRYRYGLFKQAINAKGEQIETPEPWLDRSNPWELKREEINYSIKTNGKLSHDGRWTDPDVLEVIGYDVPVPGYKTKNCISLRLWSTQLLSRDLNLQYFNLGRYQESTEKQQRAHRLCAVLYPADCCYEGKELRLSQQYLLSSATIQDILCRFKRRSTAKVAYVEWPQLPNKVAIQLNDTHPSLSGPELMRILIDQDGIEWEQAWSLTTKSINYTNHTVLPEALEKWHIKLIDKIQPRLMQIIRRIHHEFCMSIPRHYEETEAQYRSRVAKLAILDCVDEINFQPLLQTDTISETNQESEIQGMAAMVKQSTTHSEPVVSMAHLCIVTANAVNGVAELHTDILKREVLADFYNIYPHKFENKTNGVTPRRWLSWCNPALSQVITKWLGNDSWITELKSLELLRQHADDPLLQNEFYEAKKLKQEIFDSIS